VAKRASAQYAKRTIGSRRLRVGTGIRIGKPVASERHFNGTLEVDISSMRQLVTDALKITERRIDNPKGL
jgi:hypothetical protein